MGRRASGTRRVWRGAGMAAVAAAVAWGAWEAALRWTPFPEEALRRWDPAVVVTDRDGHPMRVRLSASGQDCRPIYAPDPDDWIVKALVAAEDQRFWTHGGLDFTAVARAVLQNVAGGRRVSGASTLSTQVIRLARPRPRVWSTKLIEAFRAAQMERRHDKIFILGQWLNRAPFGGNIVGIEAAAERYFGKPAGELGMAEAALLAGVPQSPSRLRPDRHFGRAKRRQAYVLGRMRALGMIDPRQETIALDERLRVRSAGYPSAAPHFCDWAGVECAPRADGTIRSTIDADVQAAAEGALRARLEGAAEGLSGAVVVLENATGAVRAMVGSPDYRALPAGQVNGALAPRAAGSTLKPFVYAMAMDRGWLVPASPLGDEARHFRDFDPQNFDRTFSGRVSAREALVESLNLPAVAVARRVGLKRVLGTLRSLGLGTLKHGVDRYGAGLALGGAEVRLLDLANAYACLARGGVWKPVAATAEAAESAGRGDGGRRVFSAEACWLVADSLSGDERALDFSGHIADAVLPRVAWKTGTSAGLRDAWTVAWNPEWTVGVWVGRPDGRGDASLVGRTMAVPVAASVFRALHPDGHGPRFARPAGVAVRKLCTESGCIATPACPETRDECVIAMRTIRRLCPLRHDGKEGGGGAAAVSGAAPDAAETVPRPLQILRPADGSTYVLLSGDPSLDQTIPLEARTAVPCEVYWWVDGRFLAKGRSEEPVYWGLTKGEHRIVCATAGGETSKARIRVE